MNKEFVLYELALRLKALGFDEPCLAVFELIVVGDTIPKFRYNWESEDKWFNHNKDKSEYKDHDWYWSAPTFSQAFRFFREKYHFLGTPNWFTGGFYCYTIKNITEEELGKLFTEFPTYEEAELACLEKLIEVVSSEKWNTLKDSNLDEPLKEW